MTQRRYSDDEVAAILAKAIETDGALAQPVRNEGLSLAELQNIGKEVGLAPELVARAAQSLDAGAPASARTLLGFPIAVERTVMLNRHLTDEEWELLVVKLREAFNARGRMSAFGSFRQWTNGNLQALLEPTRGGHRLRLRTVKGSAAAGLRMGSFLMMMSGVVTVAGMFAPNLSGSLPGAAFLFTSGVAMAVLSVLPLRRWARERKQQMEYIAQEIAEG
jgi:hypothetical protein